ncbi:MAG: prepilin-type N-terminal cleavage/methylation domain-containing protein [Verrucomicrobiota bacterium]|jgi:prepilin-type N-terminal cleavage/methylation domain-containing protein/prepilin-type processing-associated H-X9-DG protein
MRASRAFTLIELLVAIAIIAILAALLLTALGHVKSRVQAVGCLNNLQHWGAATHLYALDNDGLLPRDGWPNPGLVPKISQETNSWYVLLPQAIGLPSYFEMPWRSNSTMDVGHSIWICPSNTRRSNGTNLFHYCLNELIDGTGADEHRVKLEDLPRPASIVHLFDSRDKPPIGIWSFVHTNLHNRGAQFVFLDGHAARFNNTEYWNFKTHKAITNNPALVWIP